MTRKAIYTSENEEKLLSLGEQWNFHEAKTNEYLHITNTPNAQNAQVSANQASIPPVLDTTQSVTPVLDTPVLHTEHPGVSGDYVQNTLESDTSTSASPVSSSYSEGRAA